MEAIAAYDDAVRNHVRFTPAGSTITLDDLVLVAKAAEPVLLRDCTTEYTFAGDMLRKEVVRHLADALVGQQRPLMKAGDAWIKF